MPALDAIQQTFEGQALTVCHAGPITALRVQLERGSILVRLPTNRWLAKKIAPSDDNGVPWGTPSAPELGDVLQFNDDGLSAPEQRAVDDLNAAMEQAWELYKADQKRSLASIAQELNRSENIVRYHFENKHSEEYAHLRQVRAVARQQRAESTRAAMSTPRLAHYRKDIAPEVLEAALEQLDSKQKTRAELAAELGLKPIAFSVRMFRLREEIREQKAAARRKAIL